MIPKSYNELQDKLRAAANTKYSSEIENNKSTFYPQDIIPDTPTLVGSTILTNWDTDKTYQVPFTVDETSGEIILGESTEVEAITNYEAVKYAEAEGSFEFIEDKVRQTIQKGLNSNQYVNIRGTWPDHVAAAILTEDPITYECESNIFNIPYTIDAQYNVTLGTPVPAEEVKTFEAIKMGAFVSKDESKRLVTGPVMLPGCPDCDFRRGEKVFTADEVEEFCHKFNSFRINDDMHTYGVNGEQTGDVVENYTLKRELTETNILGEEIVYPVGTWMITSKVTNDETWNQIEDGTLKGYSGTYLSNDDAQNLLNSLGASKSEDIFCNLFSQKRTLIKDLKDPVPVTVSFVDRPCVANAIFTSVKSDESFVTKAGRMLSNVNQSTLQKAYDAIGALLKAAAQEDSQTTTKKNMNPLEVLDMEEKDVIKLINDTVEKSNKKLEEKIDALKVEPEVPEKVEKEESEEEKVEAVKTEDDPVIKGILDTQKLIVEKLGIDPAKKSLESPETPEETNESSKFVSANKAAELLAKRKGII